MREVDRKEKLRSADSQLNLIERVTTMCASRNQFAKSIMKFYEAIRGNNRGSKKQVTVNCNGNRWVVRIRLSEREIES